MKEGADETNATENARRAKRCNDRTLKRAAQQFNQPIPDEDLKQRREGWV